MDFYNKRSRYIYYHPYKPKRIAKKRSCYIPLSCSWCKKSFQPVGCDFMDSMSYCRCIIFCKICNRCLSGGFNIFANTCKCAKKCRSCLLPIQKNNIDEYSDDLTHTDKNYCMCIK